MKDYLGLIITLAVAGVVFGVAWRYGYLLRLTNYVQATQEELKKCTWPSWDELKGSTVLVMVSIILIGLFTTVVDLVGISFVHLLITPG